MRVLISGGGIAGLTLAYWLHQSAISCVVIEQAESLQRKKHCKRDGEKINKSEVCMSLRPDVSEEGTRLCDDLVSRIGVIN
jgi:2-polyprenyl-6-methoxyphenol hydroxylase-like FAD-dependent oxidoreductase